LEWLPFMSSPQMQHCYPHLGLLLAACPSSEPNSQSPGQASHSLVDGRGRRAVTGKMPWKSAPRKTNSGDLSLGVESVPGLRLEISAGACHSRKERRLRSKGNIVCSHDLCMTGTGYARGGPGPPDRNSDLPYTSQSPTSLMPNKHPQVKSHSSAFAESVQFHPQEQAASW
jgi:hypothetical protein